MSSATQLWQRPCGALPLDDGGVEFRVWAPDAPHVAVRIHDGDHPLERVEDGIWTAELFADAGDDYLFVLDGAPLPDPWSRFQPDGLRGPSRIVDTSAFSIAPGPELTLDELVLYELHVGTFTPEGTFDAVDPVPTRTARAGRHGDRADAGGDVPGRSRLGLRRRLHVRPAPCVRRAGRPRATRRCGASRGLGVLLDVVYNHIGPGSDAIGAFGPYFTDRFETFWGTAIDYSQRGVREWAIQNALLWTTDYGIDGLRLDAVHSVHDDSPVHVLCELKERVPGLIVSEMGYADFTPLDEWGHDAMWLDNLHHELHVALTGEREGYYAEHGSPEGLVRELTRPRPERLVVAAQNHDQVGNRAIGDRLPPDAHRVALAVVLFSTFTPLLFMGEEHDETAPFQFFTDHIDPGIAEATRDGRKREFEAFASFSARTSPTRRALETFERSRISHREPDPLLRAS